MISFCFGYFLNMYGMVFWQGYEKSSRENQFVTRFFLREILNQMSALVNPLVSASESLDISASGDKWANLVLSFACKLPWRFS